MNYWIIFIILGAGIGALIVASSIAMHDDQVRRDQLQDLFIQWAQDDDCDELQEKLDSWNEYIMKPEKTVKWLEQRMIELECKN